MTSAISVPEVDISNSNKVGLFANCFLNLCFP